MQMSPETPVKPVSSQYAVVAAVCQEKIDEPEDGADTRAEDQHWFASNLITGSENVQVPADRG